MLAAAAAALARAQSGMYKYWEDEYVFFFVCVYLPTALHCAWCAAVPSDGTLCRTYQFAGACFIFNRARSRRRCDESRRKIYVCIFVVVVLVIAIASSAMPMLNSAPREVMSTTPMEKKRKGVSTTTKKSPEVKKTWKPNEEERMRKKGKKTPTEWKMYTTELESRVQYVSGSWCARTNHTRYICIAGNARAKQNATCLAFEMERKKWKKENAKRPNI